MHCLDHMVWGFVKPFYVDCQLDRSSTSWAWAHHTRQYLGENHATTTLAAVLLDTAPNESSWNCVNQSTESMRKCYELSITDAHCNENQTSCGRTTRLQTQGGTECT